MSTIEELKATLDAAKAAESDASSVRKEAEKALAGHIAQQYGVKIGSVVRTESIRGYGPTKKTVVSRYRVSSISYREWGEPPLNLVGNMIRKDGTPGEKHTIWRDWTVEPETSNA